MAAMPMAMKTHSTGATRVATQNLHVSTWSAQPGKSAVPFEQFCVGGTCCDTPGTTGTSVETPGTVEFAELGTAAGSAAFAIDNVVLAAIGAGPGSIELPTFGMAAGYVVPAATGTAVLYVGTALGTIATVTDTVAWRGPGCG